MSTRPLDTFTFTHNGRDFTARVFADDANDAPWDREDGHGAVEFISDSQPVPRGWTVIHDEHRGRWVYDTGAAIVKAAREHWGSAKTPAARYAAVKQDREHLAGWLRNDWCYVGVCVTPDDDEGADPYAHALWGLESDLDNYLRGVACELADECEPAYVHEFAS